MKALLDLFKQVTQEEEFDAIKIAYVFAVNINDLNTAVSFVKNVVLKLPYQKCVVSAWVILI